MDENLNKNNSHSIGPCIVKNGTLYDYFRQPIKEPTVLLDIGENTVVLLKYGTKDKVKNYYKNMLSKYMKSDLLNKLGFDKIDKIKLILFNESKIDKIKLISFDESQNAKYTVDEICAFINWVNNTIYTKDLAICISSEEQMHKKLNELMEIGF